MLDLIPGTGSSNPLRSTGESANFRYLSGTTCARGAGARDGTFGGGGRRVGGVPDSCRVLLAARLGTKTCILILTRHGLRMRDEQENQGPARRDRGLGSLFHGLG